MNRLDKVTNWIILMTCIIVLSNYGFKYYLFSKSASTNKPAIKQGQVVNLPGYSPDVTVPTLVMAISTHCHFCQESEPFYRKLSAFKNSSPQGFRIVAVLPEKQEEATAYLKANHIETDQVLSEPLIQIGIKGTPTLLLLDGRNKLEQLWVGKLGDVEEETVLATLKKSCPTCSLSENSNL